ncbi:hypothetical protein [Anabaena sp. 4-3]|nr:hypothetical protein [Anabaena sp. 4-3]
MTNDSGFTIVNVAVTIFSESGQCSSASRTYGIFFYCACLGAIATHH